MVRPVSCDRLRGRANSDLTPQSAFAEGCFGYRCFWGASVEQQPEQFQTDMQDLIGWLAEGKLKPHIGARYCLEQAPRAIADLMEGRATGKLVIEIE